jgi:hypothetical protein
MDRASQALAEVISAGDSASYRAVSEKSSVPHSMLHRRKHGGASIELKAQSQQYLTPDKEKAIVRFLLLMSSLGHPVRIKYIPLLAFSIARRRSTAIKPIKLPGKNWAQVLVSTSFHLMYNCLLFAPLFAALYKHRDRLLEYNHLKCTLQIQDQAFEKRHKELKARKVRAIDWNRHENNIYSKIAEWFEVMEKVLQGPAILSENVYNMDETGVMLHGMQHSCGFDTRVVLIRS